MDDGSVNEQGVNDGKGGVGVMSLGWRRLSFLGKWCILFPIDTGFDGLCVQMEYAERLLGESQQSLSSTFSIQLPRGI